ncbi:hypothetical protein GCM10011374_25800 [Kocuria dechangensis]|uniref:Uncharacterized protein n=1 Tax=Kocuria dechangensis TaxID=1176249 RepID=A0A917LW24_9MICC|nr:hypothetical protein GCM10011374_25800 [Kocuria dechangensis]
MDRVVRARRIASVAARRSPRTRVRSAASGIGGPVTLRQYFSAAFRTSPSQYRARFRAEATQAGK